MNGKAFQSTLQFTLFKLMQNFTEATNARKERQLELMGSFLSFHVLDLKCKNSII